MIRAEGAAENVNPRAKHAAENIQFSGGFCRNNVAVRPIA